MANNVCVLFQVYFCVDLYDFPLYTKLKNLYRFLQNFFVLLVCPFCFLFTIKQHLDQLLRKCQRGLFAPLSPSQHLLLRNRQEKGIFNLFNLVHKIQDLYSTTIKVEKLFFSSKSWMDFYVSCEIWRHR